MIAIADGKGPVATPAATPAVVVGQDTLARAKAAGIDSTVRLADNDAYGFFEAIEGLVVTGPTLTNVNDFRAILVMGAGSRQSLVKAESTLAAEDQAYIDAVSEFGER